MADLSLEDLNKSFLRNSIEFLNYPTIKIDQDEDSPTLGQLFIEERIKDPDTFKWSKKKTLLNTDKIECTILRKRFKFDYFDQVGGVMIAQTNEFDNWDDIVYVYGFKDEILMSGYYTKEVKPWLLVNFPKGSGHMFTMKHVLYIEFKGVIYRLFISSTSMRGAGVSFKDAPDQKSYEGYIKKLYKMSKEHIINYLSIISAKPKKIKIGGKTNSFYSFEFDLILKYTPKEVPLSIYNELDAALSADEKRRFHDKVKRDIPSNISQPILQKDADGNIDFDKMPDVAPFENDSKESEYTDKALKSLKKSKKKNDLPWDDANDDL